jgi:hypothetical protein
VETTFGTAKAGQPRVRVAAVPDLEVPDLKTLADQADAAFASR